MLAAASVFAGAGTAGGPTSPRARRASLAPSIAGKSQSAIVLPPLPPIPSDGYMRPGGGARDDPTVNEILNNSILLVIEVPDLSMCSKLRFRSSAPVLSAKQVIERRLDNPDAMLCSALFNPLTGVWLNEDRSLKSYLLKNGVESLPSFPSCYVLNDHSFRTD